MDWIKSEIRYFTVIILLSLQGKYPQVFFTDIIVQLSSWHAAALPTRCHSACCWSNVAPSTVVCIVIRSCGASDTSFNAWGQSLCGCWTTCMEQFTSVRHLLLVPLTFKKYLKTCPFTARIRLLTSSGVLRSSLGRLRRSNFVILYMYGHCYFRLSVLRMRGSVHVWIGNNYVWIRNCSAHRASDVTNARRASGQPADAAAASGRQTYWPP